MAIRMSGIVSNMDTDAIVKELMSAQSLKKTKVENKKTKMGWTQDKWKDLNTKIYKFYTDQVTKMRMQGSYQMKKATSSDESVATATTSTSAAAGSHTLEVTQLASSQYVTGNKMNGVTSSTKLTDRGIDIGSTLSITSGTGASAVTKTLTVTASTTINDYISTAKSAGLNASYDTTQGRIFLSSKESGTTNQFSLSATSSGIPTAEDVMNSIGLTIVNPVGLTGTTTQNNAVIVAAADANITLDGAALTGSSNTFKAAGITFSLKDETAPGENIKLNVSDDTQATYDMIKNFVKEYNSLLKEMNTAFYAGTAKGYEPLTDDQKDAMSDTQIEQWETKIKDTLLRRDTKLGIITDALKNAMSSIVSVDGKDVSLATYGIMTSKDYTEKGLLHIYGDSSDSTYAFKKDKLMAALQENPDKVADAFSQIATNLYKEMNKNMKSSSLNSALTFYNDKLMTKQLTKYTSEITDWNKRLETMETKYYKQFSAMETAMSKLNSQSASLSSMLGI